MVDGILLAELGAVRDAHDLRRLGHRAGQVNAAYRSCLSSGANLWHRFASDIRPVSIELPTVTGRPAFRPQEEWDIHDLQRLGSRAVRVNAAQRADLASDGDLWRRGGTGETVCHWLRQCLAAPAFVIESIVLHTSLSDRRQRQWHPLKLGALCATQVP